MKLNNKGFDLKQMLIISAVLFIFLLIVAYYIIMLYNQLDSKKAPHYARLESEIKAAAVKYASIYDAPSILDIGTLKDAGFIELFTDNNDKDCDGYVSIDGNEYTPYIKCEFYKTRGYREKNRK